MAIELSLFKKKDAAAKKVPRGRIPTKRYINFMEVGKKPIKWALAIPLIIVIIALAAVASKFAVIDKLTELSNSEAALAAARKQLDDGYDKIDSFGELTELYGHYTYSGMTSEELARVDRVEVLEMIRRVIIPRASVGTWSIKDNVLTIYVTGDRLQSINLIVQDLEEEDMVDYCTIITASTDERRYYGGALSEDPNTVTAQVTVYLIKPQEGGAN